MMLMYCWPLRVLDANVNLSPSSSSKLSKLAFDGAAGAAGRGHISLNFFSFLMGFKLWLLLLYWKPLLPCWISAARTAGTLVSMNGISSTTGPHGWAGVGGCSSSSESFLRRRFALFAFLNMIAAWLSAVFAFNKVESFRVYLLSRTKSQPRLRSAIFCHYISWLLPLCSSSCKTTTTTWSHSPWRQGAGAAAWRWPASSKRWMRPPNFIWFFKRIPFISYRK